MALCFLALACASGNTDDPDLRRRTSAVELLTTSAEIADRQYDELGEVEANSCARQSGASPSEENAREKLRIEIAKIHGDAGIAVACEEAGMNVMKNCWRQVVCRADAIRWKAKAPADSLS